MFFSLFYNMKKVYIGAYYKFGFYNLLFDTSSLSHWNIQELLKCKYYGSEDCSISY